jgi:hypothetical protein
LILDAACAVQVWGTLSLPLWIIGSIVVAAWRRGTWQLHPALGARTTDVSTSLWCVAAVSILGWAAVMPFTQSEQRLRARVESDLLAGRIREAVVEMSRHDRGDFPPHWVPPPRAGYGETKPDALEVMEEILKQDAPSWVQEIFLDPFDASLEAATVGTRMAPAQPKDAATLARYQKLLAQISEGPSLVEKLRSRIESKLKRDEDLPEPTRLALQEILKLASNSQTAQ